MNIKDVLRRPLCEIIDAIEARLSRPRLRIIKTLYVNFRCFPLRNAVKFPILIYGRFNILRLGRIRIEAPRIYHGMIRFGQFTNKTQCPTRIVNSGTIVFSGDCAVWGGVLLELGSGAELTIGEHSLLGENVRFMLRRKCVIGKYARIAFDSQFMDSDFHYMLNIEDGTVKNCTSFIEIGAYNWIGNRTTVKKGTVTPDYTIVAAPNAMLSKDYTKICSPFPILAGCPAKQIASGYRRVFNIQTERDLTESFKNDTGFITCDLSDNIDDFCNNHPKP